MSTEYVSSSLLRMWAYVGEDVCMFTENCRTTIYILAYSGRDGYTEIVGKEAYEGTCRPN